MSEQRQPVGTKTSVDGNGLPDKSGGTSTQLQGTSTNLTQMFGLDPRAAALVMLVDMMIFGGEMVTLGAFLLMSVIIAAILGFIVYRIQRSWFRDDHDSALIKGMIVGLLTAIPAPLSPLLAVPCGVVGAVQMLRRPPATSSQIKSH